MTIWGFPPHTPDKRATLDPALTPEQGKAELVKGSATLTAYNVLPVSRVARP